MVLWKKYPQFGQLHNGSFMRQDAEECWTQILYTLSQALRRPSSSEKLDTVKELFGIALVSRVHCAESGEENSETESVHSLKCHISHEVNNLHEGLKHVPDYSILRKVDYPLELDIFDLCSDNLRKHLEVPRQMLRYEEGRKAGLKLKEKSSIAVDNDVKMPDAEGLSEKKNRLTGVYDLVAVLTHKGRSADSGHYVAWLKQENGDWHMAYICMYKARPLPCNIFPFWCLCNLIIGIHDFYM
ncbi:unnamed protein product [Lactuca saligna]|uniref:ubiquitinyl hydrolase 1 n=1 Tax=Lactuca saligna TaxID=75948 RepID=A0AA35YCT8_LACSI|nr:unnamed protein product [Lactuca saligna]